MGGSLVQPSVLKQLIDYITITPPENATEAEKMRSLPPPSCCFETCFSLMQLPRGGDGDLVLLC